MAKLQFSKFSFILCFSALGMSVLTLCFAQATAPAGIVGEVTLVIGAASLWALTAKHAK
jgi:hypothetical protein